MTITETAEVPPGTSRADAPEYNDWKWQLKNRITRVAQLEKFIPLDARIAAEAEAASRIFRMAITPHYLNLILSSSPEDRETLLKIVLPRAEEMKFCGGDMADPLNEDEDSPVHGLVHRYPDRVLLIATQFCAAYCRFCTRKRLVGKENGVGNRKNLAAAFRYIASDTRIRDVIISGGDPLTLPDEQLEYILQNLRAIPNVEIIRIGTKAPIYLPQRITPQLLAMLRKYHPLWMSVNVTHPAELAGESALALEKLADAGIPLGSQTVLLHEINDCPETMKKIFTTLLKHRVRPYYLYQCDLSQGLEHFRTPVSKGIEIMEHLRGHISGYAVPTFVVDAPGGGGKIPVQPSYMLSQSADTVVLRNYEGRLASYKEPRNYKNPCESCERPCSGAAREGVASLLTGGAEASNPPACMASFRNAGSAGSI